MHTRWTHWIDHLLATALAASLAMAVLTAISPPAHAAERITGSGQAGTEQRTLADFEAVSLSGSFDVVLRQGPSASITVRTDQNLLPWLETVVQDSRHGRTLVVRFKRGVSVTTSAAPRLEITTPRLNHLEASGASQISVASLRTPKLVADVSGSGRLRLNALSTDALTVSLAGSADLDASGQARVVDLSIAGSADVQADALKADDVRLSVAGSGHAAVQAQRTLDVSVAGSGQVVYSGAPQVRSSVAGSGSVTRR